MIRTSLSSVAIALAVGAGAARAHEPSKHADAKVAAPAADPALAAAYAVVVRFGGALKAADFETVQALLADDVVILEMGGAEHSREEYMGDHAIADAAFLGGSTVRVTHRTGRVRGATVWVATESDITPAPGSDAKPMLGTETMVLRKDGDAWRIAHIHWSSRTKKANP